MGNDKISYLADAITPEVSGVIWLTDGPISIESHGAMEFNYLLNGNLFKYLSSVEQKQQHNFHLGTSFSKPFFVAHSIIQNTFSTNDVDEHFKLIKQSFAEGSNIFVYNNSTNTAKVNVEELLQKKYTQYIFKHLFL